MDNIRIITSKINREPKKKKYKILTFPTHEGYQTLLDKTGHTFYLLSLQGRKVWETKYRPVPDNHEVVPIIYDELSDVDFIFSHERFGQLQTAMEISQRTRLPILHMEHVEPQDDRWSEEDSKNLRLMHGDINIFITNHNRKSWGFENDGLVIPHGIDTDVFSGWSGSDKKYVLYAVNQLKDRDYFCGHKKWEEVRNIVQKSMPNVEFRLVGDNPGISRPISDVNNLVEQYNKCSCYINTSQLSPVPMTLLEAMSCGCPVVSSAKQEIPSILNGDNGFCSNDTEAMANKIIEILNDNEYAKRIGNSARETAKQRFSLDSFVDNWNNIFDKAYDIRFGKGIIND